MKQTKRLFAVLVAVVMLVCVLPVMNVGITASAISRSAFDAKLDEVRAMYPQGSQRTSWPKGSTCHGYARWISEYVWGYDFANGRGTGWSQIKATSTYSYADSIRPGDVIRFRRAGRNWNHTIFITDVSSSTLTYTDCNSDGNSTIMWNQTMSKSAMDTALKLALYDSSNETATYGYIAQYQDTVDSAPTYTEAPSAPVVSVGYTNLVVGEETTLSWTAADRAAYYWISCWSSTEHTINERSDSLSKTISFSQPGTYGITVVAINDVGDTTGNWVYIHVYDPSTITVTATKKHYSPGETATWSFNADGASGVHLYIYKGGNLYFDGWFAPAETYSRKMTDEGYYAYYITAHYPDRDISSTWDECNVSLLQGYTSTGQATYCTGETATWHFSAPFANSVILYIYKDGSKYFEGQFSTTDTYSRVMYTSGHYSYCIVAHYSTGDETSAWNDFDVVSPIVKANKHTYKIGETATFTFSANNAKCVDFYIYKDGNLFFEGQFSPTSTYNRKFDSAPAYVGNYSCYIIAHYDSEDFQSDICTFSVENVHIHTYSSAITVAATCASIGTMTFTCSCGDSYTETSPSTHPTTSTQRTSPRPLPPARSRVTLQACIATTARSTSAAMRNSPLPPTP